MGEHRKTAARGRIQHWAGCLGLLFILLAPCPSAGASTAQAIADALERWDSGYLHQVHVLERGVNPAAGQVAEAADLFLQGRFSEAEAVLTRLLDNPSGLDGNLESLARSILSFSTSWNLILGDCEHSELSSGEEVLAPPGQAEVLLPLVEEVLRGAARVMPARVRDLRARIVFLPRRELLASVTHVTEANIHGAGILGTTLYKTIFLVSPASVPDGYNWQRVLAHELIHFRLHCICPGRVPMWFEEGMAWLLDDLWRSGEVRGLDRVDRALLEHGRKTSGLGWTGLEQSFAMASSPEEANILFLQSALATGLVVDKTDVPGLWEICHQVAGGARFWDEIAQKSGYKEPRFKARVEGLWARGSNRKDILDARVRTRSLEWMAGDGIGERLLLADLVWGRGRPRAAQVLLDELEPVELRWTSEWAGRRGAIALELDQPEVVLEVTEKAASLEPDSARLLFLRGRALADLGRREEGLEVLERAIRLQPFAQDIRQTLESLKARGGESGSK